jgi:hypothetical protein
MLNRIRHHSRGARMFWIAALLIAFVWGPALLAASEAHESGHLIQAAVTQANVIEVLSNPAVHTDDAHDTSSQDPADPWHGLMHLGHCCAFPHALPSLGLPMLERADRMIHFGAPPALPHSVVPGRLLRPPIAG